MKIQHIEIYRYSIRMIPFTIAIGTMDYAQNVFIRIHTDTGIYGVGECSAFPMIVGETQETCLALAKDFAKIWKGKDSLDIPARLQEIEEYCVHNHTIKSAFDMALYDLAAKSANQPLYQFLSGSKRTIETDITIGLGTAEKMAATAKEYADQGASIIKVKLGQKVEDDLERLRRIRATVPADMRIRIDANQGWTLEESIQAFNAMEEQGLNIQFCEQPMRTWNDKLMPQLTAQSPVKIMADESCYSHRDAQRLIEEKACDYLNIKLAKAGGIHEALKIDRIADQAGINCMVGCMLESRLALSANLHLAYACPSLEFFDLDSCKIGPLEDPVIGGIIYNGFFLNIEDKPGIGADVKEEFLEKCDRWVV